MIAPTLPGRFAPARRAPVRGPAPTVAPGPPPPYRFKRELIDLLSARLPGVPVAPNSLPAEGGADPMLALAVVDGDSLPLLAAPGRSYFTVVQIDAWGTDEGAVETLAARLMAVLHGYRGPLGAGFIQSSIAHRQMDDYVHEGDLTQAGVGPYRSLREFRIVWTAPR